MQGLKPQKSSAAATATTTSYKAAITATASPACAPRPANFGHFCSKPEPPMDDKTWRYRRMHDRRKTSEAKKAYAARRAAPNHRRRRGSWDE